MRQTPSPIGKQHTARSRTTFQHLLAGISLALLTTLGNANEPTAPAGAKPALTVSATTLQPANWPYTLSANGNVAAWQEAVIGAEIGQYRITEVRAEVGDKVKKGQILLRMASDTVESELAEARASVLELEALLAEARANSQRARQLQERGFYSPQQGTQYLTAEQTSLARLNAARARQQAAELRLAKTVVTAPDEGVISARNAAVGSLTQAGQELFRLIRGGRLEWRAEVTANEILRIKPGISATLSAPDGTRVEGRVRSVAPIIDPQTRNALVYVDLPGKSASSVRAGMFVRGEFSFAAAAEAAPAMTLPRSAILLRDGFSWVFRLDGKDDSLGKVAQLKVSTGRQNGERVEITGGLPAGTRVVASGAGFLADGDTVRIVAASAANATGKQP